MLCRGVLRMTIINSASHLRQITDPVESTTAIMTHMTKMTYQDWKTLIEGASFSRMLGRIGIKEASTITTELKQTLFTTIGIALEYLAWVMPESYRRYLNRNYQPPALDKTDLGLSEEEIMRRLQDES